MSVPTNVPPQVAWEFITTPGQRMSWQPWVTEVDGPGRDRRPARAGSANHCMHGKDAVVEEILDWRPYDYVTDRTILDTPTGPMKLLHTVELEPTTAGTTIHFRYAAPKTKREKELMTVIGPAYGAALESGVPSLLLQLDAVWRLTSWGTAPGPSRCWRDPGRMDRWRVSRRSSSSTDRALRSPGR